jgi:hypothetical protein
MAVKCPHRKREAFYNYWTTTRSQFVTLINNVPHSRIGFIAAFII